jgi:hypothetical protein
MLNKKCIAGLEVVLMIVGMFAFSFMLADVVPVVSAAAIVSNPSMCCERTVGETYCVNTDEANCDANFKKSPTSCESTSYCKLGTCYDSEEGICMENTPKKVCDEEAGAWDERGVDDVPQCQLGCCLIADQAAFVPLVRCKRLSSFFGVANNYRTDVNSELQCIALAQSQDMGACVYEKEFERICDFTTRSECSAAQTVEIVNGTGVNVTLSSEKRFYKDYLCSAEELNSVCAKQVKTGCYQGDVYWFDSCGNRENVYAGGSDAEKDKSGNMGNAAEPDEICAANDGSNTNCGNCDYLLGSRCAEWDGVLGIGKPSGADHYCRKTVCTDREGKERKNGESWCVYDGVVGDGKDPAGSRHYREVCVDGDVRVEPCADFRNEVCYEGAISSSDGDFETAACRVNRWQECLNHKEEKDCLNVDRRDCMWLPPVTGMVIGSGEDDGKTFSGPSSSDAEKTFSGGGESAGITGNAIFGGGDDDEEEETAETVTNRPEGICVPDFAPGFDFWQAGDAQGVCNMANAECIVTFEEDLFGEQDCVDNCECLEDEWGEEANAVCSALGDCGASLNYIGKYSDDGYIWKQDDERKYLTEAGDKGGFTGNVISGLVVGAGITGFASSNLILKSSSELAKTQGNIIHSGKLAKDFTAGASTFKPGTKYLITKGTGASPYDIALELNGKGIKRTITNFNSLDELNVFAKEQLGGKQFEIAKSDHLFGQLSVDAAGFADSLLTGLEWGIAVGGLAYMAGGMLGMSENNQAALGLSFGTGTAVWKYLATYGFEAKGIGATYLQPNAFLIGAGVAAIIFIAMYKTEEIVTVSFNCEAWQAPNGGNDCEKCNDPDLPCSEYRCKSLGQNCEIVNEGTEQEQCVDNNPREVNPPVITPYEADLTSGYKYTNVKPSPPSAGFNIVQDGDAPCIKAFTPLEFGISTDEPAQCKVDINHTKDFDSMTSFFGGNNLYLYNHTEKMMLPGAEAFEQSGLKLENGQDMSLFIRCKDKNGNTNDAEYAIRFCVDPSPDNTAPQVSATSIGTGSCVAEDVDTANVDFYINEPAQCKWSHEDQSYSVMQNEMACSTEVYQINALQTYTCSADLSGISRQETDFYVRCRDQPTLANTDRENDRNENKQSYQFSLKGSTALKMKNLMPNGTLFGAVNPTPVGLGVETLFGCDDGKAICYYSESGDDGDYIKFFDTESDDGVHKQTLYFGDGNHRYYFKCVDSGGNVAVESTNFRVDIDVNAPVVARVYEDDEMLKVVTVRESECVYSFNDCDFSFSEGIEMPYANSTTHVAQWKEDKTYYIKCRDEFREDSDCSIIVKPSKNFL